ncbi:hypothetical protein BDY21DRAFT_384675 [Lineolata rhizophorae]|uniref:non-specific serine/threonine protein kinase n=1 Tax=Lineolata rhizophorae TaxID=578093 RepID=A0A6A6P6L6_9PEZI|nr:hypothetical protein BDY21DRAFT_384675 [Lineolata rhizophorae]
MSGQAKTFPSESFEVLPAHKMGEEGEVSKYKTERFYHIRLGEVFESRYEVVAKLGFDTASTVWLCGDLKYKNILLTFKVRIVGEDATNEVAISGPFRCGGVEHPGKVGLRAVMGHFQITGPYGSHKNIPDMSRNNTFVGAEDAAYPYPSKFLADCIIHLSYTLPNTHGAPATSNFCSARLGELGQKHSGNAMPGVYREPEIIIWDLFEGSRQFRAVKDNHLGDEQHLRDWSAATPIPDQTLRTRERCVEVKVTGMLVALARKILSWLPKKRPSAEDIFEDEFLIQYRFGGGSTLGHRFPSNVIQFIQGF